MAVEWQEPKLNWVQGDRFNLDDYNRIKNNLQWLYEKAVILYKAFSIANMGPDMTEYTAYWDADKFNTFEQNLETINANIYTKDYGESQRFFANAPFIKWDELNRIESASLNMKKILDNLEAGLPRLAFRLGANKEVKI